MIFRQTMGKTCIFVTFLAGKCIGQTQSSSAHTTCLDSNHGSWFFATIVQIMLFPYFMDIVCHCHTDRQSTNRTSNRCYIFRILRSTGMCHVRFVCQTKFTLTQITLMGKKITLIACDDITMSTYILMFEIHGMCFIVFCWLCVHVLLYQMLLCIQHSHKRVNIQ